MRVQFEFTQDDLVDASRRFAARSKVVSSWKWTSMFTAALFAWLLTFALFYRTPGRGALVGLVAAFVSALIYPTLLKSGTQKRLRKLHQEILGNENSFVCEVELTPYGFTVSQMNREIKYSWQAVKEIKETSDSVDIFTRDGGGVIVRNRAFQSVAERMTFVESATSFLNENRG